MTVPDPQEQRSHSTAGYCRGCGYELAGLSEDRCPECGQSFDPTNPRTYQCHPRGWLLRLWLRRAVLALVTMVVLAVVSLPVAMAVLHIRWKAQEQAVAAIQQAGGRVSIVRSRSKLLVTLFGFRTNQSTLDADPGTYSPGLLGTRFAYLTDRAVHVQLFAGPGGNSDAWQGLAIDDAWLANLRGLSYVRIVEIASSHVTDAGLEHLRVLPRGGSLAMRCPKLSRGAVEQLGRSIRLAWAGKLRQPPSSQPTSNPSLGGWLRED